MGANLAYSIPIVRTHIARWYLISPRPRNITVFERYKGVITAVDRCSRRLAELDQKIPFCSRFVPVCVYCCYEHYGKNCSKTA
jgi:hypothetical protein